MRINGTSVNATGSRCSLVRRPSGSAMCTSQMESTYLSSLVCGYMHTYIRNLSAMHAEVDMTLSVDKPEATTWSASTSKHNIAQHYVTRPAVYEISLQFLYVTHIIYSSCCRLKDWVTLCSFNWHVHDIRGYIAFVSMALSSLCTNDIIRYRQSAVPASPCVKVS